MIDISCIVFEDDNQRFGEYAKSITDLGFNFNHKYYFYIHNTNLRTDIDDAEELSAKYLFNLYHCLSQKQVNENINKINLSKNVIILLDLQLNGVVEGSDPAHFLFAIIEKIASQHPVVILMTSTDGKGIIRVVPILRGIKNVKVIDPNLCDFNQNPSPYIKKAFLSFHGREDLESFLGKMAKVSSTSCHVSAKGEPPLILSELSLLFQFKDLDEMASNLLLKCESTQLYGGKSSAIEVLKNFSCDKMKFSILGVIYITFLAYRHSFPNSDIDVFSNVITEISKCEKLANQLVAVKQPEHKKFNKIVLSFYDMIISIIKNDNQDNNFQSLEIKGSGNSRSLTLVFNHVDANELSKTLQTWQSRIVQIISSEELSDLEGDHLTSKAIFKYQVLSSVGLSQIDSSFFGAIYPMKLYSTDSGIEIKFEK